MSILHWHSMLSYAHCISSSFSSEVGFNIPENKMYKKIKGWFSIWGNFTKFVYNVWTTILLQKKNCLTFQLYNVRRFQLTKEMNTTKKSTQKKHLPLVDARMYEMCCSYNVHNKCAQNENTVEEDN